MPLGKTLPCLCITYLRSKHCSATDALVENDSRIGRDLLGFGKFVLSTIDYSSKFHQVSFNATTTRR